MANPFKPDNETWATCYLKGNGDEKNVLKLDNRHFTIIKNGRSQHFDIHEIKSVHKSNKRLLLPLILGGILSPLALVAIYENLFSPFLLLSAFFTGIFLLYIGWAGSYTLVITMEGNKDEFIFLRTIPKQVLKFIDFFNLFLMKNSYSENMRFFHIYYPTEGQEQPDFSKKKVNGYVLFTNMEYQEFQQSSMAGYKALVIDPLKLKSPVILNTYSDGNPHFTVDSINSESIC